MRIFQVNDGEKRRAPTKCFIGVVILLNVILLCIGIGIGYAIGKNKFEDEDDRGSIASLQQMETNRLMHHENILNDIKADNIRENLRHLTKLPHFPGSKENEILGDELMQNWKKQGIDHVEKFKYNIYLSYPKQPGQILIMNGTDILKTLVIDNEPAFDESEKGGKVLYPFNAFSAAGNITAEVIYGNYGLDNDFIALQNVGINVKGKIMIFRYGKTSRTMKLFRAEKWGAVGVIIYSDPYDYVYPGQEYPNGYMLNKYAVQRGTINRLAGDALTIGYPAKDNYFRLNETKYSGNPKIPSQPISYGTAFEILSWMNNNTIPLPVGFQGGLNFTYSLYSGRERNITLKVFTELKTNPSYTVCGTLYGSHEPDRYILLGNHRDAWTYGATDPSSGTATLMEIMRALGEYKKKGWRPYRSIMACSWGAEESGIQGSTEWADENRKFLMEKVILYLNIDMAVEGNFTVRMKNLDSLSDSIYNAAKKIPAPDDPSKTLYQDWLEKSALLANSTVEKIMKPKYFLPTSGSDYKALWHSYGTALADFRYIFSKIDYPRLPANPHYHTLYESFGWMSKIVDPEFKYHQTIGKLCAGVALSSSDSTIIPIDIVAYTKQLQKYLSNFDVRYKTILEEQGINFNFAHTRLNALNDKAKKFKNEVARLVKGDKLSPYKLRAINDRIMNFERNFLIKGLVPSTPVARHVVYSTTYLKLYSERFPGISEAIYNVKNRNSSDWDEVRKQITYVIWCIDNAERSLDLKEIAER